MTELKTLRDIFNNFPLDKMDEGRIYRTDMADELRQEAIKWIKSLDKANEDNYKLPRGKSINIGGLKDVEIDWEESSEIYGMIKILKHFFNITEEDLK